jgi:flagellar basal-body rod protein FlgB
MVDPIQPGLEQYLNLLASRQKIVASNIANAETPGYHSKDIDFQFEFQSLAATYGPKAEPNVIETPGLKERNDGNNVSMDREMRLLSENALRFQFVTQMMRNQVGQYRKALQSSRG